MWVVRGCAAPSSFSSGSLCLAPVSALRHETLRTQPKEHRASRPEPAEEPKRDDAAPPRDPLKQKK